MAKKHGGRAATASGSHSAGIREVEAWTNGLATAIEEMREWGATVSFSPEALAGVERLLAVMKASSEARPAAGERSEATPSAGERSQATPSAEERFDTDLPRGRRRAAPAPSGAGRADAGVSIKSMLESAFPEDAEQGLIHVRFIDQNPKVKTGVADRLCAVLRPEEEVQVPEAIARLAEYGVTVSKNAVATAFSRGLQDGRFRKVNRGVYAVATPMNLSDVGLTPLETTTDPDTSADLAE